MSAPANWHHDLAAPAPRPVPPVTWMRPTPPMPRPRPALRLADALVNWGTAGAWVLAGIMAGGVLVGLAGLTVGVS